MSGPVSPKATPKRKRDDIVIPETPASRLFTTPVFTFELPNSQIPAEDGSSSPRTKVANKLRSLSLERSGGGVQTTSTPDDSDGQRSIVGERSKQSPEPVIFGFSGGTFEVNGKDNMQLEEDDNTVRKRHKHSQLGSNITLAANGSSVEAVEPAKVDEQGKLTLETVVDPSLIRVVRNESLGGLKKSYPSINRLSDSRSRARRRSGTPPLHGSRRKSTGSMEESPPVIVDPVRAALTWHEDEITVYDSEDKDDDGTGLNGIGFRPTPAIAYHRAQMRKKQLAEYKKREETEARARRNQKRREALGGGSELQRQHSVSRVHFSEAEPDTLVMT